MRGLPSVRRPAGRVALPDLLFDVRRGGECNSLVDGTSPTFDRSREGQSPTAGCRAVRIALSRWTICLLILALPGCPGSAKSDKKEEASTNCDDLEPENPYSEGSGHFAGFAWAEKNEPNACSGNSPSFVEGCKEYQRQAEKHEACESKK